MQAVLHLVATAVPGLKPQAISIVDSRGALLARGGQALAGPGVAQNQEEIRRTQELRLGRAVEELLERSLGPGRVRAEATVEMDFDRVETREERFDPDNQVARSQQSTTEQNRGAEPAAHHRRRQPAGRRGRPGAAGTSENRQEETTNYEIGRSTRNTLREHPVVKRLSVAVLVDGLRKASRRAGASAARRSWPASPPWCAARSASTSGAATRSRSSRMRFVEEPLATEAAPGFLGLPLSPALATRLAESALLALVALAGILLVGRPMVGRIAASLAPVAALAGPAGALRRGDGPGRARRRRAGVAALAGGGPEGGATALPACADAAALTAAEEAMVSLAHVQGQMRASSLNALSQMVQRHPDESLAVLRRWLDPEDRL